MKSLEQQNIHRGRVVVVLYHPCCYSRVLMTFLWPIGITKPPLKGPKEKDENSGVRKIPKCNREVCYYFLFIYLFGLRHSELAFSFSLQQYKLLIFWCWCLKMDLWVKQKSQRFLNKAPTLAPKRMTLVTGNCPLLSQDCVMTLSVLEL